MLIPIDFRRAFRRLGLDDLMDVEAAFAAIEDPHHQIGATLFIKTLSWSKRGVPRSIPKALKRAEKRRKAMEARVGAAIAKMRREADQQAGGKADATAAKLRKELLARRRKVRREGRRARKIAVAGLRARGFQDTAEAFTFFDSAGVDGGGFVSHVELELGFRRLKLVAPAHSKGDAPAEAGAEPEDPEQRAEELPQFELQELLTALDDSAQRKGQVSFIEFVRELEWGPLRDRVRVGATHDVNAVLDRAMIRRKPIREAVFRNIEEEDARKQAIVDARLGAARSIRATVRGACEAAARGYYDDSAEVLRGAVKRVPEAAVKPSEPAAAELYDVALRGMLAIGDAAATQGISGLEVAADGTDSVEAAAERKAARAAGRQNVDGALAVLAEVQPTCNLACAVGGVPAAAEGGAEAAELPPTPESLEGVAKLTQWRLVTAAGGGLLGLRVVRASYQAPAAAAAAALGVLA